MYGKSLIFTAVCLGALMLSTNPAEARTFYVGSVGHGVYSVYDPKDASTVYVYDPQSYIKSKNKRSGVTGFGGSLSAKAFAKGDQPIAETVHAAAGVVASTAGVAYNAANMVPSWRRYTGPIRTLFGGNSTSNKR